MKVTVDLGSRSYDILIKAGLLAGLPRWLDHYGLGAAKGLLITDDKVDPLYGYPVQKHLLDAGRAYPRAVIPAGEESKSQKFLFRLYDDALEAGLDRKALVLALGGGVVGDLAGYVAASYLRGLRFVQLPTTLLAMVDSAVGGKTGINLPRGKNLVGAFHQPSLVLCDLDTLKTLSGREFRSGLAEVIKYGIIADAAFFQFCEEHLDGALKAEAGILEHLVSRSCMIKADVVRQDETESGLRAILNFGHTLGHAIETVAGYGKFLHGEAIAIGMVFAARLSVHLTGLPPAQASRIEQLFARAGLPVKAPGLSWSKLQKAMSLDKKSSGGKPRFVLAREIGQVDFGVPVEEKDLLSAWESMN
ncbi:MAG TPA: 3-dehydroquinate synthase [Kiritimatiellia bacterium]|nr:3-dehydroquinate synthase [Kiritimatiellia bacterium]HMO98976.1 3-dehydroquinate synthase [Kiritimatiellia bacterium]HMP96687.1 3-dehydroquinate synthase [Kiritimatiellia bacterium]